VKALLKIHENLRACQRCPDMCGRAVHGPALRTKVMLIGQAPGIHEGTLGRPFAYTAGKTLFKWFESSLGADEETLRELIYFSAVARCFPGKAKSGKGDRAPSKTEIENCREHLRAEMDAVKPKVVLAVGKVAIAEVLAAIGITPSTPLEQLVGSKFEAKFHGHTIEVIPLPHPSGVSRWPHTEPGKTKLKQALELIRESIGEYL
jgi:uracil-DNA glycosylase